VSDSDSSDEGERVVRSAKDKAWDGMKAVVSKISNARKINDWHEMQTQFDLLNKQVDKAKTHIQKEGLPRFYIRTLAELEDSLDVALKDKEAQKKMSKANGRALNRMKLQLRRHNKEFEAKITEYRANPDAEEESASSSSSEESSSSEDESSSDESSDEESVEEKPKKVQKNLEDMDSDDWASSSDESESSSSEDEDTGELKGRARWLKRTVTTTKRVKKERVIEKKKEKKVIEEVKKDKKGLVSSLRLDAIQTGADFDKKLTEVMAARGRKGTDPRDLKQALEVLAKAAQEKFGFHRELQCCMHLIASHFDSNRTIDDYMDVPTWRACHGQLTKACSILEAHPQATLGTVDDDELADLALAAMLAKKKKGAVEEEPEEEEEPKEVIDTEAPPDEAGCVKVVGNLLTYVTRLEDEYVKSLQHINPHTQEYVARLRDERPLEELAGSIQAYYDRSGSTETAATVALLRIEHMYYKHDSIAEAVRDAQAFRAAWGSRDDVHAASRKATAGVSTVEKSHPGSWLGAPTTPSTDSCDTAKSLKELCGYVYDHGDDRCRTRALLCHVAHHALHGRFHAARDLLLMSHLQEVAHDADIETQILYNRAMVLLGLCAFRSGLVHDAHSCLAEICSSRVKELLAQGVQSARWSDKSDEQEKAERRRQTPYHMHVNLDLLECCHLTSAMLLEVPAMVVEEARNKQLRGAPPRTRVTSRHFRKHMDIFSRQVFTGPPENTRDHILCAAKALALGDWRECARLVVELDVWDLIPGTGEAEKVKAMVREKIKAEALRTYLFARADAYDALSLERLCATFEMPERTAHGLVSKMMITKELRGAWDQPTKTIVLRRLEPSPVQALALAYADRCAALVDANERLLDARAGGKGYKDDRRDWDHENGGNKKNRWGGRGGRGGDYGGRGRGRGRGKGRGRGRRGSNSNYVQRKYGNKKYGDQDRRAASARRW